MNRFRVRRLLSALMGLTLLGLGACAPPISSVQIIENSAPDESCAFDNSVGGSIMPSGRLDLSTQAFLWVNDRVEYYMYPLVRNSLMPMETDTDIETNYILVGDALVDLDFSGIGGIENLRFSVPAGGGHMIAPGDTGIFEVRVIPKEIAELLAPIVRGGAEGYVNVTVKFEYLHGEYKRTTHEIEYGIYVCDGCVLVDDGPCDSETSYAGAAVGCNAPQDKVVHCCATAGGGLACP